MLYNFSLTPFPTSLSYESMPDSAYATPGRYLLEMARRLRERHPDGRITLINPLYDPDNFRFLKIVALIRTTYPTGGNLIIADAAGHPLAYIFDTSTTEFAVSLVSTIDAQLDSALLSELLGEPVPVFEVQWKFGIAVRYSRFYSVANFNIYVWLARHALAYFRSGKSLPISITAIMPYHAGDVLFFALAAARTQNCIKGIAICREYMDIVRQHAPELFIVPVDVPPLSLNDQKISEEDYFLHHIKESLPEQYLYAYLRPSGDYNRTFFHLIDHFAFALGASPRHPGDLVWFRSLPTRKSIQSPVRILLHFDAGWPMKIYPKDEQRQLIDLLLAEGYRVTVLSKTDAQYESYRSVAFHNYRELLDLLANHDIVIGMDSFPAHLAAHSIGLPTICLYSSTRPDNSNAPSCRYYTYLERSLPCRPCHAKTRCPVYGGDKCRNFVSPVEVASRLHQMLRVLGESQEEITSATDPPPSKPLYTHHASKPVRTIRLEHLGYAIILAFLNPLNHLGYILQVGDEFLLAWRRQGMARTIFKSTRFMFRQVIQSLRK